MTGSMISAVDRKLTVVLASSQRRCYGGERQMALLADGLRRCGHRVIIVAQHGTPLADWMIRDAFPTVTFRGRAWNPVAVWKVLSYLRGSRVDVLHFNDPHSLLGFGVGTLLMPARVRVAARRVVFAPRHTWHYSRLCQAVICVSGAVRAVCRRAGLPDRALHVVHDGVEPATACSGNRCRGRSSLALESNQFLLLVVASLTDVKGHRYLIDAMPQILSHHAEVVLALAGEGELRCQLEQQVARLGLHRHVRFLGYRHDIPDLLAAADLLVVPSDLEGLCSSVIDAMLAGCAVVASSAGGLPDLLGQRDDEAPVGWLVAPRSPQHLARAIHDALQHPQRRADFAHRAQKRARKRFTAQAMVDGTLKVYHRLLNQNRSSR